MAPLSAAAEASPAVRLADYRPAPWAIDRIALCFQLGAAGTEVRSRLECAPNPAAEPGPLVLQGVDLELLELRLDGEILAPEAYALEPERLVIAAPPRRPAAPIS